MKVVCRNVKFWTYWYSREMFVNSVQSDLNYFLLVQIIKILFYVSVDIIEVIFFLIVVQFGDLIFVKELIDFGMDINMLDDNMCIFLGLVCFCVNVKIEVVKLFLDYGVDVNRGGGWKKQKLIIFVYVYNLVNKIKFLLLFGVTLIREEMINLVFFFFLKFILENLEVIILWSKEFMFWNLLLDVGFILIDNDFVFVNKID